MINVVVEQHGDDVFIAYPAGLGDVIVGQGETEDAAVYDAREALKRHLDVFGRDCLRLSPIEASVHEVEI